MRRDHEKLNYVEFPASDLGKTEAFFQRAFGWTFTYFGPEYMAFDQQGLEGGFFSSSQCSKATQGAALLVFYSEDLASTQAKVEAAGGVICHPIFEFPGGRRFHFEDPSGNQFGVWQSLDKLNKND